jgi:hypothetical protein
MTPSQTHWLIFATIAGPVLGALLAAGIVGLVIRLAHTRAQATFAPAPGFGIVMAAAARRRGAGHIRQLTILGDGAAWIWNLAGQYFPEGHPDRRPVPRPRAPARAGEPGRPAAGRPPRRLAERLAEPGNGDVPALIAAGHGLKFTGSLAGERDKALHYFDTNAHRMRYARYRSLGLFVGSGTVEAGCKSVGQRLRLSGMRWTEPGATGILTLRCQEASNRWEQIWQRPHNQTPAA